MKKTFSNVLKRQRKVLFFMIIQLPMIAWTFGLDKPIYRQPKSPCDNTLRGSHSPRHSAVLAQVE